MTWMAVVFCAYAGAAFAADMALVGARIHPAPDVPSIDAGTVLIRDGRIAAVGPVADVDVPSGAQVIDLRGRVVTAGFWNSHVHLLAPVLQAPRESKAADIASELRETFTRWGFTTVFDLATFNGSALALRDRMQADGIDGPAILTVAAPFFPAGGTPIYVHDLLQRIGAPSAEVATAEEARSRARRQLAEGADGVKLFAGAIVGGETGVLPIDADAAKAVASAARRASKPSFAHPTDRRGLDIAIDSGVDVLAHSAPDAGPWDDATVARLRDAGIALIPTLTLFEYELRREGAPDAATQRVLGNAMQQVGALSRGGGTILFGTDVGYMPDSDTRREFELLADAGLDWRAILASLTTSPADRFGRAGQSARVAVGSDADLVVLMRDPALDATAFSAVQMTIRGGRIVFEGGNGPVARANPQRLRTHRPTDAVTDT